MRGRDIIIFIDNESARHGLINGSSPSISSQELITAVWQEILRLHASVWFARVPTVANIADLPSRGRWKELEELGYRCADQGWQFVSGIGRAKP